MASNNRQRRVVAAIVFSTLGLIALLVAQGGTQMVAASLLPLDAGNVEPLGTVRPTPPTKVDPIPILRRNIFDHETGRLDIDEPPPVAEVEAEPEEELDPNAPPPACDGSMRLVGAFIRVRREEDSFAAITSSTGEALLYQTGMQIDGREVVAVQRNRVILRPSGGSLCSLTMFAEEPRVATASRAPVAPTARPIAVRPGKAPGGMDQAELDRGITRVNERQYTIQRSLVDRLLSNQAALMRTARVIPHEEGGRVVGVKLYGIRRSSLLGRLGIQNGDMLRTINGYDMTAPDSALEAYARLRTADRITINLQRRGSDQTIDYQIR